MQRNGNRSRLFRCSSTFATAWIFLQSQPGRLPRSTPSIHAHHRRLPTLIQSRTQSTDGGLKRVIDYASDFINRHDMRSPNLNCALTGIPCHSDAIRLQQLCRLSMMQPGMSGSSDHDAESYMTMTLDHARCKVTYQWTFTAK